MLAFEEGFIADGTIAIERSMQLIEARDQAPIKQDEEADKASTPPKKCGRKSKQERYRSNLKRSKKRSSSKKLLTNYTESYQTLKQHIRCPGVGSKV